jgi:protease I
MADEPQGKKIAFLMANEGVEEVELTKPLEAVREAGADAELLADELRTHEDAVSFVREFFESGKPVGVICHGPWTLIEADVVKGRTVTSWPSLRTDLRNAGAEWVDREVVTDQGLVTSRKPDDLPAFDAKIVEEFAEGAHAGQTA